MRGSSSQTGQNHGQITNSRTLDDSYMEESHGQMDGQMDGQMSSGPLITYGDVRGRNVQFCC